MRGFVNVTHPPCDFSTVYVTIYISDTCVI